MKTGKKTGTSDVSLELIADSAEVRIQVIIELSQGVLDELGMPAEWTISIVFPIFNGKGDIRECSFYRAVKLLEHGMMVVEWMLEKVS